MSEAEERWTEERGVETTMLWTEAQYSLFLRLWWKHLNFVSDSTDLDQKHLRIEWCFYKCFINV